MRATLTEREIFPVLIKQFRKKREVRQDPTSPENPCEPLFEIFGAIKLINYQLYSCEERSLFFREMLL